jgi:mannose-6-phosphate isomerase-like protein (cupin superfamily)
VTEPSFSSRTTNTWVLTTAADSNGDVYEQRVEYLAGSPFPPAHYHPAQDEHFEVESGAMVFVVDGEERRVNAGESIEIDRGRSHKARNGSSDQLAVVRWETRPALRSEEFYAATAVLSPSPIDGALLANEYRDVFRLSGPAALLVPVLARLGRLRGRDLPRPVR